MSDLIALCHERSDRRDDVGCVLFFVSSLLMLVCDVSGLLDWPAVLMSVVL